MQQHTASTQCYTHTVLTYAGGSSLLPSVFIKLSICSSTHGVIDGDEGRGEEGRGAEGRGGEGSRR